MVEHVIVVTNDIVVPPKNDETHVETWNKVLKYLEIQYPAVFQRNTSSCSIDGIILSPGPGSPAVSEDVGICTAVSKQIGRI